MSKLSVVAQNVQDLFYKAWKSDEDFWEEYHFKYLVTIGYAAVLQREYERSYAKNKQEEGQGWATLNSEWFVTREMKVERSDDVAEFVGELPCDYFQFNYDRHSSGIKDIISLHKQCREFVRTTYDERFKLDLLPPSPEVYWFTLGRRKIYFSRTTCGLSKVLVHFIPALDPENDDAQLPNAMEDEVVKATLNLFHIAKQGNPIVDVTADSNPNATMATEINNMISKLRKQ